MNSIKKISYVFFFLITFGICLSCETTELNLTDNPNGLSESQANADFLLNEIQAQFAENVQEFGRTGMEVTRITNMAGRNYQNAYSPASQNARWSRSYQSILKNIRIMTPLANAKGLKYHLAIAKVIEAFTIVNLVDFYGDVPYTEAVGTLTNPAVDKGAVVYAKAVVLLDEAIVLFSGSSLVSANFNDLFYNKVWAKWSALANSLKLKIYAQSRLVDPTAITKFNAIIAGGNYIKVAADDFQYDWGISLANPDSRHPIFVDNYLASPGGTTEYQSISFMDYMKNSKSISDPRMKYYFYRQVASNTPFETIQFIRCSQEPIPPHYAGFAYCSLANGYWGRDHGNSEGIPPDGDKKTAYGVYPGGGRFDDNSYKVVTNAQGAKGDGITPIFLSSTVDFLRAELALNGGTGDAKALLTSGIAKSFTKVRGFISRDKTAILTAVPAVTIDATYLAAVGNAFDSATSSGKMELVANEFFVSLFGNGIDAYNFYRRTGFPVLTPAPDPLNAAHTTIPNRYTFALGGSSEYSLNPEGIASSIATLSPATDVQESKIWWDK